MKERWISCWSEVSQCLDDLSRGYRPEATCIDRKAALSEGLGPEPALRADTEIRPPKRTLGLTTQGCTVHGARCTVHGARCTVGFVVKPGLLIMTKTWTYDT